jgi:hypothetical protein
VFHHTLDMIEAHLTVVFAALAVTRHLTTTTGLSIKRIVHELDAIQTATIELAGQRLTIPATPSPAANKILDALKKVTNQMARAGRLIDGSLEILAAPDSGRRYSAVKPDTVSASVSRKPERSSFVSSSRAVSLCAIPPGGTINRP